MMRAISAFLIVLASVVIQGEVIFQTCDAPPGSSVPDNAAAQLLQKAVSREIAVSKQHEGMWMYESKTTTGKSPSTKEVIETNQGNVFETVSQNGKPFTKQQKDNEDRRLQRLISDSGEQQKLTPKKKHDTKKAQEFMAILPRALKVKYNERYADVVQLDVEPNPGFHPTSREERVVYAMAGTVWVNTKESRLAEIDGHLIKRVDFGAGYWGNWIKRVNSM
jgi:hypothetical protein